MTIDEARREITKAIRHIYDQDEMNNIAELLTENLTKLPRSERIIKGNEPLSASQKELLSSSIQRLQQHEPIQYVINEAWFAGMRFYVDRNVLIPRPETEELVEWIVKEYRSQNTGSRIEKSEFRMLDVGTGSGCIAITLKNKLPGI